MASNGEWGDMGGDNPALDRWEKWQALDPLPMPGEDKRFDRLCSDKALTREDFVRVKARLTQWNGHDAIAYHFRDGIKYRMLDDGSRATEADVKWVYGNLIKAPGQNATTCVVAEGETDGAQLSALCPAADVLILPAGAKHVTDTIVTQLRPYDVVYLGLDNDEAGHNGAAKLGEMLVNARRILPPDGKDWCEYARKNGREPIDLEALAAPPTRVPVFTLGEVLAADLGTYEDNHWFEYGILPVRGLMMIHAAKKSGKSFIALDLGRAISTGTAFAGSDGYEFIRPNGPGRVLLFQFEVPPYDFQARAMGMIKATDEDERELLRRNFNVYRVADGVFPRLRAGDGFLDTVRRCAEVCGADVLLFDPFQRMTGGDTSSAKDMDPLLDAFAQLQHEGYTVVFSHHNNKSGGKASRDSNSSAGTQRFSGDPDSLCSVWWAEPCVPDDNPERKKQRNFTWELRSGGAAGRSITLTPDPDNERIAKVRFDQLITPESADVDMPDII